MPQRKLFFFFTLCIYYHSIILMPFVCISSTSTWSIFVMQFTLFLSPSQSLKSIHVTIAFDCISRLSRCLHNTINVRIDGFVAKKKKIKKYFSYNRNAIQICTQNEWNNKRKKNLMPHTNFFFYFLHKKNLSTVFFFVCAYNFIDDILCYSWSVYWAIYPIKCIALCYRYCLLFIFFSFQKHIK